MVFVIDTTSSMGPYIDRAREVVRHLYDRLGAKGLLENTSFGLVAYRNNMDREPQRSRLEYVTCIFQRLDGEADPCARRLGVRSQGLLDALDHMTTAKVSTHRWDEDAAAGLYDALYELDWKAASNEPLIGAEEGPPFAAGFRRAAA